MVMPLTYSDLFHAMTWLDYIIIAVILCSMIVGVVRGFLKEVISLLTWIVAIWLAVHASHWLSGYFTDWVTSPVLRIVCSVIALMVVALVLGSLLGMLCKSLVSKGGLNAMDRSLGVFFGFLRGVLLVVILLVIIGSNEVHKGGVGHFSILRSYFQPLVHFITPMLPEPDMLARYVTDTGAVHENDMLKDGEKNNSHVLALKDRFINGAKHVLHHDEAHSES